MSNHKIKLLVVTNSIPLPAGDYLRDKTFGLNEHYDLHLISRDSIQNRKEFLSKYPGKISEKKVHLFHSIHGVKNILILLFTHLSVFIANPKACIQLAKKINKSKLPRKKKLLEYLLFAMFIKIKPDIVHFEFGTLGQRFENIKKYFNCKASVSFRGYDINHVGIDNKDYYTKVWDTFDGYHFLGNDLKRRAMKRGYERRGIEALIAPAINTSIFKPLVQQLEPQYKSKLIIVSTGRLVWKKGFEYGVRAVALLKERGIPIEYRIIGYGEYEEAIKYTILELGLEKEVLLLGKKSKDEVAEELGKADIFLHPAISEGFCNAVLEAQAVGLPVIASDAGGLPENVADGVTGFIVPMWNVEAIADKVEWMYNNQNAIFAMGKAGIERANTYFTAEKQIKQFVDFYQSVYES